MKRLITFLTKPIIATALALSIVYIPAFAAPAQPATKPTTEGSPVLPGGIKQTSLKKIDPIPQPNIAPVAEVQPIPVPTPAPAPQPQSAPAQAQSGCVTGYVSGDYYLDKIIAYESGGNSCATNPGGCFGLLQACPGEPLRAACGGDPTCQIAWFQANKTGGRSWAQVWQHELDYGWW